MPKHAAPLDCSADVRAELTAMSRGRSEEARMVERARIVLACLQGKEIQQVAREIRTSIHGQQAAAAICPGWHERPSRPGALWKTGDVRLEFPG